MSGLAEALDAVEAAVTTCRRAALAAEPDAVERSLDDLAHATAALRSAAGTRAPTPLELATRNRVLALRSLVEATLPYLDMPRPAHGGGEAIMLPEAPACAGR